MTRRTGLRWWLWSKLGTGDKIWGFKERSHSGLVRALGERLWPQGHRGFESLPLRQL